MAEHEEDVRAVSDSTTPRPVFVPGIGPPLSQIRTDYEGARDRATDRVLLRAAKDVLALIDAVEALVAIAEAAEPLLEYAERMHYHLPKSEEWYALRDGTRAALAVWRERKEQR